jgi:hypothetical protein
MSFAEMTDQPAQTPFRELLQGIREENARLHRCITMAMGCLDPESDNPDERLAWYRLWDAEIGNREPRCSSDVPSH